MMATGIPDGDWDFDTHTSLYSTPSSVQSEGIRTSGERQSATHFVCTTSVGGILMSQKV